jgi:hypothetical protein
VHLELGGDFRVECLEELLELARAVFFNPSAAASTIRERCANA